MTLGELAYVLDVDPKWVLNVTASLGGLQRYDGSRRPVRVLNHDGTIATTVDVYRLLAAVNAGLSKLRTMYAPRRGGRRPSAEPNPIRRAATYGLDLTLLESNLRRT